MTTTSNLTIRRATERGFADHGWLKATHTFSFADYYDPAHMQFRSLRVMNEDRVAAGMGFPTHPHRDMEIITYVVSGALEHRDSMGNGRVIQSGDVQYMSAGSGVQHSEFNPSRTESVHLYQIWILPDERNAAPRYAEKAMAAAGPGLHLVASKSGREESIAIRQDAEVFLGKITPASALTHTVRGGRGAWVQVVAGDVVVNAAALSAGDGASLEADADTALSLSATAPATVLLFDLN
jgi:redox-sensitive bicupin YhaK (pirin superfamily)